MDGDFYVAAALATTLTKLALRYVSIIPDKRKQNVSSVGNPFVSVYIYGFTLPSHSPHGPPVASFPPILPTVLCG